MMAAMSSPSSDVSPAGFPSTACSALLHAADPRVVGYDTAQVEFLTQRKLPDLAAVDPRWEVEAVARDQGPSRVVELDSERLAGAFVADHATALDVLQADAGLASGAGVVADEGAQCGGAEGQIRSIDRVDAVRVLLWRGPTAVAHDREFAAAQGRVRTLWSPCPHRARFGAAFVRRRVGGEGQELDILGV